MSRYQWPIPAGGTSTGDDGRAAFEGFPPHQWPPPATDAMARTVHVPKGRAAARRPRAAPSGLQHLWQPLGPAAVLASTAAGAGRIAGRINALSVHPDGQRIYAASANAGVWYSSDGGVSWKALGGFSSTDTAGIDRPAHRHACNAIAVVFGATEADDVVYVGTGEVAHPYNVRPEEWLSAQPGRPFGGVGILRGEHPAITANDDPWVREAKNLIGNGVYRFAIEPGGTTVIAATLTGLYQRPAAGGLDVDWVRPGGAPFDALDVECTDVLWTAGGGARPARLWVWVQRGPNGGLWVRDAGQTDFTRVETPGARGRRAALAASTPPDRVWVFADHPEGAPSGVDPLATARAVADRPDGAATEAQKFEDCCDCWFRSSDDMRQGFIRGRGGEPVEVTYSVIGNSAIFQGDIYLGTPREVEQFTKAVRAARESGRSLPKPLRQGPPGGVLRGVAITGEGFRWPGGIVAWVTQPGLRALVQQAIRHWESRTRIRFVERTAANQAHYPNWISFESLDGCHSLIGMQGGMQKISLGDGCGFGAAVHEIGHALGLFHEQSREDRDTHVRVQLANVKDGKAGNFAKHVADGDDIGAYDFASIMHYDRKAFSKNGEDTIVPLGGQSIGQRDGLSGGDIAAIRHIYPDLDRPLLFRVATAGAAAPVAVPVIGLPDVVTTQGFYDIAIAVDPSLPDRVVLGGSTLATTTAEGVVIEGHAAIVRADVSTVAGYLRFGTTIDPHTMIGIGVPRNVHHLHYSNAGARLWAAVDGGVFRSDHPDRPAGFHGCNNGIGAIDAHYIGAHPFCEGHLAAGLQNNRVGERVSSSVWRQPGLGGSGGIAFDPLRPDRYVVQRFKGSWASSDGSLTGPELLTRGGALAQAEMSDSAPYSMPAAIAHRRGNPAPAAANLGQLVVGTKRLWYSENFGGSWVTLPAGTDPLPGNLQQDSFDEPITVCRWQSPDVAWALGEGRLMRYARTPGSDAGGGPGTWSRELVITRSVKNKKDATSAEGPIRDAAVWTDIAVNLDAPPAAGQPPAQHGTWGAMYLGTIGKPGNADVDTLWWFDGTSTWFKTGLRADATAAPVTAIACDSSFPDQVYVGTTVGVWKGIRTQIGDAVPAWTWHARLNGLPEAAVEDLAIFSDGGLRLLRASIAGHGIWELRLDTDDLQPLTYLRAHDDDLRLRPRAGETRRDGTTPRSWHGSPDVRPRLAPAAVPAPASLPWTRSFFDLDNEALRRFQAALRARTNDPRVRPTGEWDLYFNEVLRDLGAPIMPRPPAGVDNLVSIDAAFWNLSMQAPHATAEPWGTDPPSEADLLALTPELSEGYRPRTSCSLPPRAAKVDVVVHHRGPGPIDGGNIRVTLLRWIDPRTTGAASWSDSGTWSSGNVPWTAAVNEVLNSPGGTTALTFADGWRFVETAPARRRRTLAAQTLDAWNSGVVTFDLDLTGLAANRVVLLVAVIRSGANLALAPDTLENLALTSPSVAVRSVRVFP